MKLKRYTQFINESLKDYIDEKNLWKISEDDIREYLIDLTDNGYLVTVTFGFVDKHKTHGYKDGKWTVLGEKDIFTEKVTSGENVRPAYYIKIERSRRITNTDVSESFRFAVSIISETANAEVSIFDNGGGLGDTEGILIKGGLFYTDNWNSGEPETLEADEYIAIFAKQKETVKIEVEDLMNYYGWTAIEKDGKYLAEMDLEDLANNVLSSRSDYKDSLIKGQEIMWDYYDISNYEPDINSLFSYTLEKETKELLAKALIKEFGGFEKVKHSATANENFPTDFKTEEELVDYFVNERHNELLKKWIKTEFADSEVYREVTDTVANWEMSAHCDDNYKEIVNEFDEIVKDELGEFNKITREIPKTYTLKDGEKREYKVEVTYYQFPYTNTWIEDMDSDSLYGEDLSQLFKEWIENQSLNYELNPRISDYGDVDDNKMNEDITRYLRRYLSK